MSDNLGFLTVIDQAPGGLTGGYLVLNKTGRPLEFHCTMPLLPDKIQQILYGDTLQPFLYGERIAQTLVQRSKLPVLSVLTNHAAVLPVQTFVSTPIIYVFGGLTKWEETSDVPPGREISEELSESLKTFGIDNAHIPTRSSCPDEMSKMPHVPGLDIGIWQKIAVGNRLIAVPETKEQQLIVQIKEMARTIDLLEPFSRIRLALEEANVMS
jgi:hypothetical protein